VIVVSADADALLPAVSVNPTATQISDLLFLKLADLGMELNTVGDSGFVPRLARRWLFQDSLTLVFVLDERARWQDGVPVTAQDVAFTFDLYRDPLIASPARPLLDAIASVTARDEHTVVFAFRRHYAEQFYDATNHMRILPRHLLDSIPRGRMSIHPFTRQPVGDGPYRLARWRSGESIELSADTTFALGRAGIARLVWSITPDPSVGVTRLQSGEADVMDLVGSPEQISRAEEIPGVQLIRHPTSAYIFLSFNLRNGDKAAEAHPLFGSRDLRRALTQALDRRAIVKATLGAYGEVPVGPAPRLSAPGRDTTVPGLPFDSAAARMELKRLGWVDRGHGALERSGRRLEFELLVPSSSRIRRDAAELIQDQLRRLGVQVNVVPLEFNAFQDRLTARRFDAAMVGWNDDPTPSSIQQTFTTKARHGVNYGAYVNSEFDHLVQAAIESPTPAAALARWKAAYAEINADAPGIWLATPTAVTAVHRRFRNVTVRPDEWSATMWTWQLDPAQAIARDAVASKR
jgi:peptide/nickel transport system substrate-binding protein